MRYMHRPSAHIAKHGDALTNNGATPVTASQLYCQARPAPIRAKAMPANSNRLPPSRLKIVGTPIVARDFKSAVSNCIA